MINQSSFLDLLGIHQRLEGLFLDHQTAVVGLELGRAGEMLEVFMTGLLSHMHDEEEFLIPIYEARTSEVPGGAVELFLSEHKKMKGFVAEFKDALGQMKGQEGTPLKHSVIRLLDRESIYKQLAQHHQLREQNILYPWLDRVTSDTERAEIFKQCTYTDTSSASKLETESVVGIHRKEN
jgi:hemerythrin-like domain-containing protein